MQRVKRKQPKNSSHSVSRRGFLVGIMGAGASVVALAQSKLTDGGLADLIDKKNPPHDPPIVPPGALSNRNFYTHCTGCQLCVSACPNQILKPSTSASRFMQPEMVYDNGFCRPECNRCSQVCPTGAIRPITVAQKTDISIGRSQLVKFHDCLAVNGTAPCGICERNCPVQAISMMKLNPEDDSSNAPRRPVVSEHRCIGCGACEYVCPVNPESAIRVTSRTQHTDIS